MQNSSGMAENNSYELCEPHPTPTKTHYMHFGRGGLGNFWLVLPWNTPKSQKQFSRPAPKTLPKPNSSKESFYCGRGGAGNAYREQERTIFSFDEELEYQSRVLENQAPIYHVGRGGFGNTATWGTVSSYTSSPGQQYSMCNTDSGWKGPMDSRSGRSWSRFGASSTSTSSSATAAAMTTVSSNSSPLSLQDQ